jgi:hypothetical protein
LLTRDQRARVETRRRAMSCYGWPYYRSRYHGPWVGPYCRPGASFGLGVGRYRAWPPYRRY